MIIDNPHRTAWNAGTPVVGRRIRNPRRFSPCYRRWELLVIQRHPIAIDTGDAGPVQYFQKKRTE